MTTMEAIKLIGQVGTMINADGSIIECTILDVQADTDQVLISPTYYINLRLSGNGQTWIKLSQFKHYEY